MTRLREGPRGRRCLVGLACLLLCSPLWSAPPAAKPPLKLDLRTCLALSVQNNLTARLAKAGTTAARDRILQSALSLLPRLTGSLSQTRIFKEDLPALGFGGGGFPELLGPWEDFEARLRLVAETFDMPSLLRFKSAGDDERATAMEEGLASEQVAAAAALAYVELSRARQAAAAAAADVELAADLRRLAEEKRRAGTASGIDVARAKTREAEEALALFGARNVEQEAQMRLQRVAGLPLDQGVLLKDELGFAPSKKPPQTETALKTARAQRWELRIAEERLSSAQAQWKAAQSRRRPIVALTGDAGSEGTAGPARGMDGKQAEAATQLADLCAHVDEDMRLALSDLGANVKPVGTVSKVEQLAQDDLAIARDRLADLRAQVDEDVRLALLDLDAMAKRAGTAGEVEHLAQDELAMARNRFSAGVADNVELLNSQTDLTRARDARVSALARYQAARISLALALGRMKDFTF